jgi:hypothetical protein
VALASEQARNSQRASTEGGTLSKKTFEEKQNVSSLVNVVAFFVVFFE